MALRLATPSPDSITIDQLNIFQIHSNRHAIEAPIFWHKFVIFNVHGLKRNVVLKIILEGIKPLDFIPLSYTDEGKGAFFFARICEHVIKKFCKEKLTIPNPRNPRKPFHLKIILKYTNTKDVKVDLTENLLGVLQKRSKSDVLCLNNFSEDPNLSEFFLLSQPKLLAFVLNTAKKLAPKAIRLTYNDIATLEAFKIMPKKSISSLDLRNNYLTDLAELEHLEHFDITELWLEGNPLCDLYDEHTYVEQVLKYCPKLEKLDGFLLRQNGAPSFRRNFLCDPSAHDTIDHFLENYFSSYDSKNFMKLQYLYHKDALFSITVEHLQKQVSHCCNLTYIKNSLALSYGSSSTCIGISSIVELFAKFPDSEHDPYSFTVDVVYFSTQRTVFIVTGVFREVLNTERILGFNRHFILERRNDIYQISNEQLYIFNAPQQVNAFKRTDILQEAHDPKDQTQMINAFSIITTLTKEWAKILLEECRYNFKHAMSLFIDLYKSDKIPSSSFINLTQ